MNSTATTGTVTTPSRPSRPPQPLSQRSTPSARRVGALDRMALHLGIALIRWGRRPDPHSARLERRTTRIERALHALAQDLQLQRAYDTAAELVGPRRLG